MDKPIEISVVVCTYNRAAMLQRALQSLIAQHCPPQLEYEIVVVDDGSTDATEEVVREIGRCTDRAVVYIGESGVGIAAARNAGVKAARGNWIAFTDDDQIADTAWLRALWYAQQRTCAVCIGGGRILELPRETLDALPRQIRLILGEIVVDGGMHACGRDALVCTGNLLIRREVLNRLGGFDASLTQGGEDTDLFMRLRRAGYTCWFTPHALVRHIIPPYRLEPAYLLWASLRGGHCYAHRDLREWGLARTWAVCVARAGYAACVHAPAWITAAATGDRPNALARKCSVWRAAGYTKAVASQTVASLLRMDSRGRIEFRSERQLFHNG